MQVMVGLDVGKGLLYGGVNSGRDEGMMVPEPLGVVVVDVIRGNQRDSDVSR